MTQLTHPGSTLEKLGNATIEQRLGDISGLPKELVAYIRNVYRDFITGYLNLLRQREKKPADWIPESLSIDAELADGMRHFYSDYQHITRAFYRLNRKMDRLREIDKDNQFTFYQHTIDDILNQVNVGGDFETYRIVHALPEQNPPMPDPTIRSAAVSPGIYVCGEYGSVPGIQWALLSGRQTAEEVLKMMNSNRQQVNPPVDQ